jgi:class 3 adenylate cyclase/tetratricopeptide (TPR) repeat protein
LQYLAPELLSRIDEEEELDLQDKLGSVGLLSDLLGAISMYVPEHVQKMNLVGHDADRLEKCELEGAFLYADVTGFTAFTERLGQTGRAGAEELTSIINHLLDEILAVVTKYEGSVLKFGGDSLLAVFLPQIGLGGSHVLRALVAGSRMHRVVRRFRHVRTSLGEVSLQVSIGVGSGRAWAHRIESSSGRAEYVVSGPVLQRTAQAEARARPGQLLLDSQSLEFVSDDLELGKEREGFVEVLNVPRVMKKTRYFRRGNTQTLDRFQNDRERVHYLVQTIERFRGYLPRPLFQRLLAGRGNLEIESEHRKVTTVFIGIEGLDSLIKSQEKSRDSVVTPLTELFEIIVQALEHRGGILGRLSPGISGDNVLLFFGALTSPIDAELSACMASLEIVENIAEMCLGGASWSLRVGINTGYAFCANVGGALRKEYTVMGDSVNTAARLMSAAEPGNILVGETTKQSLGNELILRPQESLRVKGKREMLKNYLLTGEQESSSLKSRSSFDLPLVAIHRRSPEAQELLPHIEQLLRGQGGCIWISGEVGIGKTNLLLDLLGYASERSIRALELALLQTARPRPLLPWIMLLRELLDLPESGEGEIDSPSVALGKSLARVDEGLVPWDFLLASYLDIEMEGDDLGRYLDMSARVRNEQFFQVVVSILEKVSFLSPMVIVLEDLETVDEASRVFLSQILQKNLEIPVLFVLTSSQKGLLEHICNEADSVVEVQLAGLNNTRTRELVAERLGVSKIPTELVASLVERCRGNPLLILECLDGLIQDKHLIVEKDLDRVRLLHDLDKAGLPDNVYDYFTHRLDRMGPAGRHVLAYATILETEFTVEELRQLQEGVERTPQTLGKAVELALDQGILTYRNGEMLAFSHPMMRETLYEMTAFETRKRMHRERGLLLEKQHHLHLEKATDILAHHFVRSDDVLRAIRYGLAAGDQAKESFANASAIEFYARVIEQIDESGREKAQLLGVLDRYARVLELDGRITEAIEALERRDRYARDELAHTRSKLGKLRVEIGTLQEAEVDLEAARTTFEEVGDFLGLGYCQLNLGLLAQATGHNAVAIRHFGSAFEYLKERGEFEGMADCLQLLGEVRHEVGDDLKAVEALKMAQEAYKRVGSRGGLAQCQWTLGEIYFGLQNMTRAEDHLEAASREFEALADVPSFARAGHRLARVQMYRGHPYNSLETFDRVLPLYRRMNRSLDETLVRLERAELYLKLGQFENARREIEVQIHRSSEESDLSLQIRKRTEALEGNRQLLQGVLWRMAGRVEEAMNRHVELAETTQKSSDEILHLRALLESSVDCLQIGLFDRAFKMSHLVFRRAREMGERRVTIQAQWVLGRIQGLLGLPDRAYRFLSAAVDSCKQSGYLDLLPTVLAETARQRLRLGDQVEPALLLAKEALGLAEESRVSADQFEAYLVLSDIRLELGDLRGATQDLADAELRCEELNLPYDRARLALLACRCQMDSDPRQAARVVSTSAALAQQIGSKWLLARAYGFLARLQTRGQGYYDKLVGVVDELVSEVSDEALGRHLRNHYLGDQIESGNPTGSSG